MRVAQVRGGTHVRLLVDLDDSGTGLEVSTALASRGDFEGLAGAIACARLAQTPVANLLSELAAESRITIAIDSKAGRYLAKNGTWNALDAPIHPPEVWGAGVTYKTSREARLEEAAGKGDFYSMVYDDERPELFLKDSASRRTTGPHGRIGVRDDSDATVPEPEFALVLDANATVVGITLANDVTARDIEARNPLYLPQAKIFAGSCALGPVVAIFDSSLSVEDEFDISLTIRSATGMSRFHDSSDTGRLNRTFAELADYLSRFNVIEDGTVLMTGTGIVPPFNLGLKHGDTVIISSRSLGVLSNRVAAVQQSGRLDTDQPGQFGIPGPLDQAWDEYVRLVDQEQERNQSFPSEYPHYTENGRWQRLRIDATSGWVNDAFYDHGNWTAGFAPAQVWLAHVEGPIPPSVSSTQANSLNDLATRAWDKTTHDLGFLFYPSFVLGGHLGFLVSADLAPAEEAARSLAERFNPNGNYLQAFGAIGDARSHATSTIDTMMNLPLLWWAAGVTGNDEYYHRAMEHAKTSALNFFRADGSTYHLIRYDPDTGKVVTKGTFQGESNESCWSRGQAWAIAGFAWCYAETGEELFRATAQRAWEYFTQRIPSDGVVPYDFGSTTDTTEDASASAIAALGALILAECSDNNIEADALREDAISILCRLRENAVRRPDDDQQGILQRSCYSKPHGQGMSGALPYGDFYYGLALALATGKVTLEQIVSRQPHGRSAVRNSAFVSIDSNVLP